MAELTVSGLRPVVHSGPVRVAFYGKCGSAKDAPLSLLRQLHAVSVALSERTPISACFADIGVWNRWRDGAPRVLSLAGHQVRGGLVELLQQAHDRTRDFDVLACFDDSRLPRRMTERQAVLRELTACGVGVATLTTAVSEDFPGSATAHQQAWSPGLLDWTADAENLAHRLTDRSGWTDGTGGDAR
ncbi:hypothetical protein [Actinophytocola sp. NPDC049390]|uniref:hypothetical protein n=1 Tax=Actinophytocola sp. NPDC049390 TaxID=3363894 RepID=UPI0037BC6C47